MKVQNGIRINDSQNMRHNIEKQEKSNANHVVGKDVATISDSGKKQAMLARDSVSEFRNIRFSSIHGEVKEIPAEYRCENLFKMQLKAASLSGGKSIFEDYSTQQSKVFQQWLDDNASGFLSEDEVQEIKKQIENITASVDNLNSQEGYKGTSFESTFLLYATKEALEQLNKAVIPKDLQNQFSDMISEYVHFNETSRNLIMERMTPDYMVVGIGTANETYKYKEEIVSGEQAFHNKEKIYVSGLCKQFLSGDENQETFLGKIKEYLNDYYGNRYELRNASDNVNKKVNILLEHLQKMYGLAK